MIRKLRLALLSLFSCFSIQICAQQPYQLTEAFALECDRQDSLQQFREEFFIPNDENKTKQTYFCGHSLGLQPKNTQILMQEELDAWAQKGVEGHFKENNPWYTYHETVRNSLAKLIGAETNEVVAMNSLTVNLHLLMVSFYRPEQKRYKILMEAPVFSSDTYAVKSQLLFHGYDPDEALIIVTPREGEDYLRMEDVVELLDKRGNEIALVLFSGVNYFNGQFVDIKCLTKKAHEMGCFIGFDLAHAIGNVPLKMHEWEVDFAAWCSYKYLNSGPGAIGGAFVHAKHCKDPSLKRFAGWWGNDPYTRFQLHLEPDFIPVETADSWQISNPSIFALAPLRASLQLFDKAGFSELREKSVKLTGYLEYLIHSIESNKIKIITPMQPEARGCQLSIRVYDQPERLIEKLKESGIICDFRRPDVLRIAPIPLYNTFHEVWQFATILRSHLKRDSSDY